MDSKYVFTYDLTTNCIITDCTLNPTETTSKQVAWLWGKNNKYDEETQIDFTKIGKWMLFRNKIKVDETWRQVKEGIREGHLWHAKVSTCNSSYTHVIIIYTKDHNDVDDVIRVLDYLEGGGLAGNETIRYKTDLQTYAGVYSGGSQKPWIYSSDTIRGLKKETSKQTTLTSWIQSK